MLELDVLLGNFLEEAYPYLLPADQAVFIKLLSCEDQPLFLWLTGQQAPADKVLTEMVEKIRHHARTRHTS